jgi:hypothetical protein
MMRAALRELGDAPAAQLADFLTRRYGVTVEPVFIPVLRASALDKQLLEDFHARARTSAGPATGNSSEAA